MNRILLVGMLLGLGCDGATSEACEPQPFRLISWNAPDLHGTELDVITANGTRLQGTRMQGTRTRMQGTRMQGVELVKGVLVALDAEGRPLVGDALVGARVPARLDTREVVELAIA